MRPRPWLLAALLLTAAPAPLFAQTAEVRADADELFRQAREAMSRSDYEHALRLLRLSQAADPGRGKLLNLAICEEELGLVASALRHFEEVLPQLAGDPRARTAKDHVDNLRPRVPRLRIQLAPGAPVGTTVTLDDAPVDASKLGTELLVEPGGHVVKAVAPGARGRRYDLLVAEGKRTVLSVEPEMKPALAPPVAAVAPAAPAPAPARAPEVQVAPVRATRPPPDALSSSGSHRRAVGFALLGVGGAGVVLGAVAGAMVIGEHGSLATSCPGGECPPSEYGSLNAYHTKSVLSTVGFIGGAAAAGVGVVVLVTRPQKGQDARASWVPYVGVGTAGAVTRF